MSTATATHSTTVNALVPCDADHQLPLPDTPMRALDQRLAIAVRKAIAEAPPLTPEQRDRIVQLLQQT